MLLTVAVLERSSNDRLGVLGQAAGLVGAVTDTVAEVGLLAVASRVALLATELVDGLLLHTTCASMVS